MITPNIIVTRGFDTMQRIFFGPTSLGDAKFNSLNRVLKDKDLGKALICAPGNNPSLLEADLNIPHGASPKSYLSLKFIETRELLEFFLLDTKPLETHFNTAYNLVYKAGIDLKAALKNLNKFYIAFGTGDNLDEWAGPFEASIGAAQVDLNNNIKVITLGFIMGQLAGISTYTKKFHGNLGFGDSDKLNSILSKNTKVNLNADVWMAAGLLPTLGPRVTRDPDRHRCLLPPVGWNTYIRHLLRRYLGQVYGDPYRIMIVLGDDMDEIFNKALVDSESKDFCRNYQGKLREFGITLKLRTPDSSNKGESTLNSGKVSGPELVTVKGKNRTIGGEFNVDDRRASRLRLDQKKDIPEYKEYSTNQERCGLTQAAAEKVTKFQELWDKDFLLTECIIHMGMEIDVTPSLKTPQTVLDPIFEFIGALRNHQKKPTTYGLYEINDIEINDFINESPNGPMHEYKTNRLVFGDVDLIKRLIYLSDEGKTKPASIAFGMAFSDEALDDIDWEGYQKKYKETILRRERRQTSSFKEKLDFGPFNAEFKEIEDQKDIIFMHGVKNSNVQSVIFNKDFAQSELMSFNLKGRKRSPFMNNFTRLAVANDEFNMKQLIDYLEKEKIFVDDIDESKFNLVKWIDDAERSDSLGDSERITTLREKAGETDVGVVNQGLGSKGKRFADFVDLIVGYREVLNNHHRTGFTAEVPYLNDATANDPRVASTYADLFEKIQRKIVQVKIKTLPFFNQKLYFDRECYFFSVINNLVTTSRDVDDIIPSTFLNGSYKIMGARHFMSGDDAFSEFTLVHTGDPGKDPILSTTREIITGQAGSDNTKKPKSPRAVDVERQQAFVQDLPSGLLSVGNNDPVALPKGEKRQEIARRLQVQIIDSSTGEAVPGTTVQ